MSGDLLTIFLFARRLGSGESVDVGDDGFFWRNNADRPRFAFLLSATSVGPFCTVFGLRLTGVDGADDVDDDVDDSDNMEDESFV